MVAYALYLRGQLAAADAALGGRRSSRCSGCSTSIPTARTDLPAEYWLAEAHYRLRQYDEAGELFDKLDQQTRDRREAGWP